nr:RNA-dependent RNA polymerase [Rhizoctonia zeae ourmia-like virus 1]
MNQKSPNRANVERPPGRHSSSWGVLRGVLKAYHRTCNVPEKVPSKSECVAALMNLPPNPSLTAISEAGSVFQFRKVLPSDFSQEKVARTYLDKLSTPSPPPPPEALRALRNVASLLPYGWDRDYLRNVESTVPSFKANIEELPPSALPLVGFTADRFRDACLGHIPPHPIPRERHVKVLDDSGKARIITVASVAQLQMRPLHVTIYDALVRFTKGTVLRGPPTSANLSAFTRSDTEKFVSGDYNAATDNFNKNISVEALRALRQRSLHVPDSIWDEAEQFMSTATLIYRDKRSTMSATQESGQLMGNYLSFPLLCFVNLAGVFASLGYRRTHELMSRGRIRINGDDIVFRCRETEYHKWVSVCPVMGLSVSLDKTLLHDSVFTINSNFFKARDTRAPTHVWIYRAASFMLDAKEDKTKTKSETLKTRFNAVNDAIGEHLKGVTNSETRLRLRYTLQKVHRKKVEGSSLHTVAHDTGHVACFQVCWRNREKAVEATKRWKPSKGVPSVRMVSVNNVITVTEKPGRERMYQHRIISQTMAWGRERLEAVDYSPSYVSMSWQKPRYWKGAVRPYLDRIGGWDNVNVGEGSGVRFGIAPLGGWGGFLAPGRPTRGEGIGYGNPRKWYLLATQDLPPTSSTVKAAPIFVKK